MDLISNISIVKEILEEDYRSRDCDLSLYCRVIVRDLSDELKDMNAIRFMSLLADKKMRHFESVRRVRQKLQEKCPQLRGDLYNKRHGMKNYVKNQLRFDF